MEGCLHNHTECQNKNNLFVIAIDNEQTVHIQRIVYHIHTRTYLLNKIIFGGYIITKSNIATAVKLFVQHYTTLYQVYFLFG